MFKLTSVDWKQSGIAEIVPTSESWLQETLLYARYCTESFCKTFLHSWYNKAFTEQRKKHLALLDDDTIPFTYDCCYRGFGKTTNSLARLIKGQCFRLDPFPVVVSKTLDYATFLTEIAKAEILSNPDITDVFGCMKPIPYQGTNPAFSKDTWFMSDPRTGEPFSIVCPKGQGQQVNGLLQRVGRMVWRPTLLLLEDPEDRKEINNDELRLAYRDWVFGTLLPCVPDDRPDPETNRWVKPDNNPRWRPPWRVIYQDTLKHPDACMQHIIDAEEWVGYVFPKAERRQDGQYYSCVPELVSDEQVRKEIEQAKGRGQMRRYAMEFMCTAQDEDSDNWTSDLYKYYSEANFHINERTDVVRAIICDPARTVNKRSAYTSLLAVSICQTARVIHFRENENKRREMHEMPRAAFRMALKYNSPLVCVEITGGEDLLKYHFERAATEEGLDDFIEFLWLDARTDGTHVEDLGGSSRDNIKAGRGTILLPFYKDGQIFHEDGFRNGALETQQKGYPDCTRWDAFDCASYVPVLMFKLGIFWKPGSDDWTLAKEHRQVVGHDGRYERIGRRIRSGEWRRL